MTDRPDPHLLGQTPKDGDFARYLLDIADAGSRVGTPGVSPSAKPPAPHVATRTTQAPPDIEALLQALGPRDLLGPVVRALGVLVTFAGGLFAVYAVLGRGAPTWMILAIAALALGAWLRKKGST